MAGMEQLQIHSKSYLLRWVEGRAEHVISWSIQPQKKGLNFGIFKHPGSKLAPTPQVGTISSPQLEASGMSFATNTTAAGGSSVPDIEVHDDSAHRSFAIDKLKSLGYKLVMWHGYCEANHVTTGNYEIPAGEGGMYALVLDNTFAKSYSKTANLALMTFPALDGVSHPSSSHLSVRPGNDRRMSAIHKPSVDIRPGTSSGRQGSVDASGTDANVYEGVLHKRRRKKGQGYAKRFFSLDMDSAALAYYHDQKSSSMRGIIPLSLAAIATNEKTREISIDSGAEVWRLRASSAKDFVGWRDAIEAASKPSNESLSPTPRRSQPLARALTSLQAHMSESSSMDVAKSEGILKRLEKERNAARQIAKDTDPKYFFPHGSPTVSRTNSDLLKLDSESERSVGTTPPADEAIHGERKSFWGRKSKPKPIPGQRSTSASSAVPSMNSLGISQEDLPRKPQKTHAFSSELDGVHDQCMVLYKNLDSIVQDLQALLAESRIRKPAVPSVPSHLLEVASRLSMESSFSQEFFDAEMGDSQLLTIQRDDHEREPSILINGGRDEEGSASEIEDDDDHNGGNLSGRDQANALFPSKPKNLNITLADLPAVKRRSAIDPPTVMPPSLIGFLRKNVGKDLSTVSMPVSANEPLSLTQKAAEMMEYSELLDRASDPSLSKSQRLLYVTAFAISGLSSLRVKERAIRKPFNPMLGETFELLREDKGYRFVAEKVCHRPVVLACQADSERWSITQSAAPTQKFWGKSAELITEGRVRLTLHTTGEHFSWTAATCFLRNIIAGEKYVEPVGSMSVTNDSTGQRAEATFKAKGMFSGRSEEVSVSIVDEYGDRVPEGLEGKWTSSLSLTEDDSSSSSASNKPPLWTANQLPANAARAYGFTAFAAALNELDDMSRDRKHLPPTDSRLRPDQRALELRDVDRAEDLKARLEDAQRRRRKDFEDRGENWTPMWFSRAADGAAAAAAADSNGGNGGEDVWCLKSGKDGYWERRARDDWKGVIDVLEV